MSSETGHLCPRGGSLSRGSSSGCPLVSFGFQSAGWSHGEVAVRLAGQLGRSSVAAANLTGKTFYLDLPKRRRLPAANRPLAPRGEAGRPRQGRPQSSTGVAAMVAPTRPHRSGTRPVLVMLALALLVTFGAGPATAAPNASGAPRYYLSLGDSLSRGVQPDPNGQNHPTDQGYADDLAKVGRLVLPQLQLVKLGCETEETTASMLGLVPSKCPYDHGSQLAQAEAFLRAHRDATVLVTLDIGANDLSRCLDRDTGAIDPACVQATFQQAPANLATILARLRAAAGPRVAIVGMNFYDPFLAAWLQGPAGQELARLSVQLVTQYNDLLEAAYQGAGMPVADVQAAFSTTNVTDPVTLPDGRQVPVNVARICQWTWMCAPPPQGPNVHGRPEGYWVMAGAFVAALVQAHRLDDGPLAGRSGHLGAALHHLHPASTAP
jgi:hypothetical protein